MAKAAIVVLADIETHEDLARVVNALETVNDFKEAHDEVRLIFDGAGTRWIGELAQPNHRAHPLYAAVKDHITGVCSYCAVAFKATEAVQAEGLPLLGEFERHPSLRKLVAAGFPVITF